MYKRIAYETKCMHTIRRGNDLDLNCQRLCGHFMLQELLRFCIVLINYLVCKYSFIVMCLCFNVLFLLYLRSYFKR